MKASARKQKQKKKQILALVLVGLTATACGATEKATSTHTLSHPAASTTRTSPAVKRPATRARRTSRVSLPRLGSSRRVPAPGTTLIVTIRAVIDPLRSAGAQLVSGMKPVGVLVAVKNAGPGGYDSSSTGDFSLQSGAGEASPVFVAKGPCQTPLQDFMNAIAAGEVRTGCVAFSIPDGQRPTAVGFAPDGGSGGRRRLWSAG